MNNTALAGFLKKQIQKYEGGVDLESNKNVTITSNGTTVVTPSSGKDGMEQVTVSVAVSGGGGGSIPSGLYGYSDVDSGVYLLTTGEITRSGTYAGFVSVDTPSEGSVIEYVPELAVELGTQNRNRIGIFTYAGLQYEVLIEPASEKP